MGYRFHRITKFTIWYIQRCYLRMRDIGLLQLFDILGLTPSVNYTEVFIKKHKLNISKYIGARGVQSVQFELEDGTHRYGPNSVLDAADRILSIIQIGGLAFHPVS